jgi:hypothetical protein
MLAPDEILLPNSACQGSNKTLLCRKIEQWRESANLHPEIRPIRSEFFHISLERCSELVNSSYAMTLKTTTSIQPSLL